MNLLLKVLSRGATPREFAPEQWNRLLFLARDANMMARLGSELDRVMDRRELPETVRQVVAGTEAYVHYLQVRARHEVRRIEAIAENCQYPVILLKGAAYVVSDNAASVGRGLSDIDVLVPQDVLDDFETRLQRAGWQFTEELTPYDHYYYRELAHELPPMRHANSQLELDVHHNLLQPTHRFAFDARSFLERAVPIPGSPLLCLAPVDQILHSVTHLMLSDELRGGLRDVHDMKLLYEHECETQPDFCASLIERAEALGLLRPLYYSFAFAQRELGLCIPYASQRDLESAAPGAATNRLMTRLIARRLTPVGESATAKTWAESLLYLRSHWIRMPPTLLATHLTRKALQRRQPSHS